MRFCLAHAGLQVAGLPGSGQFRGGGPDLVQPAAADVDLRQVRVDQVTVVGTGLLLAHQVGLLATFVPAAGLLHNLFAALQQVGLAFYLELQWRGDTAEAVEVLHLDLGSERLARAAQGDVHVSAHLAFRAWRVGHGERLGDRGAGRQDLARRVRPGGARFGDHLDRRAAGTVQVEQAVVLIRRMHAAARVLLEVTAGDADGPAAAPPNLAVLTDGAGTLARLVVLRSVRVEVMLALEAGHRRHPAAYRQGEHQGFLDRRPVRLGQGARQAQAHGAGVRVRFRLERISGAAAEQFAGCVQGQVDFKPDDALVHGAQLNAPGHASASAAAETKVHGG